MKCIVLVAGYATRLYPLTKDKPKALLPVAGRPILEYILKKVKEAEQINEIILVSNHIFYQQFINWKENYLSDKPVTVIDDGTTDNEHRLGAIADLQLAVTSLNIGEDVLVLAGDNLFEFSLKDFTAYAAEKQADCITVNVLEDEQALRRTGVVEVDEEGIVIGFEEKPKEPKSHLAVPPFYIYQKETLPLIADYIQEGHNPDAPGNFIPWLLHKKKIYTYQFKGNRYDIGNFESYKWINEHWNQ